MSCRDRWNAGTDPRFHGARRVLANAVVGHPAGSGTSGELITAEAGRRRLGSKYRRTRRFQADHHLIGLVRDAVAQAASGPCQVIRLLARRLLAAESLEVVDLPLS